MQTPGRAHVQPTKDEPMKIDLTDMKFVSSVGRCDWKVVRLVAAKNAPFVGSSFAESVRARPRPDFEMPRVSKVPPDDMTIDTRCLTRVGNQYPSRRGSSPPPLPASRLMMSRTCWNRKVAR